MALKVTIDNWSQVVDWFDFLLEPTATESEEREAFLLQAMLVALFADSRATLDDGDPLGDGDLRGFWGDHFNDAGAPVLGSRLWTLTGRRLTDETAARAGDFATEALNGLVAEGVANAAEVTTEIQRIGSDSLKRLAMTCRLRRDDADISLRFGDLWEVIRVRD
jgi:phage gp46-like protein